LICTSQVIFSKRQAILSSDRTPKPKAPSNLLKVPSSELKRSLPPCPTFTTKRILLSQVLVKLIGNGIKHHGRADDTINISVVEEAKFYRFNITDNGKGIEPKQHLRIFDIFQTLSSDKQSTGIGLAIVKKIVETEGGESQLTSEVDKGSTLSFT
jgi:signal transduction histidine kinase